MFTPRSFHTAGQILIFAAALAAGQAEAGAEGPKLGRPATAQDIAAWSMTVFPDGKGLPEGRGTVAEGKAVYQQHCASCHGAGGTGGSAGELAGAKHGLTGASPDKTIGSYWPYATTLFDFVRRSMPLNAPGSLSNGQVYAVSAYLLHINGVVAETATMDKDSLPQVKMPNRDGFIAVDAPK